MQTNTLKQMIRIKKTPLILALLFFSFSFNAEAQFWKKLKKAAEDVVVKKTKKTLEETIDPKASEGKEEVEADEDDTTGGHTGERIAANSPNLWRNYKFVPGEDVIFFDDLSREEVGEFPSRWDLVNGSAEVAELNDEKVIILSAQHNNTIKPLFKTTGYLGDEFTIEYDILIPNFHDENIWHMRNTLYFDSTISTRSAVIKFDPSSKKLNGWASKSKFSIEGVRVGNQNDWHHIAISYYKGKVKIYYDNKRISNIPDFHVIPEIFALDLFCYYGGKKQHPYLAIKNIRIAHGGGQMYQRIIADGKYTTNGIVFDSGKSTIKKTSLGVVNKIVKVLKDNKDWNLDIIGHTDNDGNEADNLTLSSKRAEAIKQVIVAQGIDAKRLTTSGRGQSDPLNTNATPEEKANNRRVVFVKK